jgi:glycosyltransferase involved in cell wall biosynthesis
VPEKPKISIIMVTLNAERFLRTALESIVAQSYGSWELVLQDGASSDGTLDVLASFRNPNFKVVSEPDTGHIDAVYKALKRARGDYFMWFSSSDGFLDKDWFASCADVLDSDPEVSVVWGVPAPATEDGVIGPPHDAFAQFLKKGGIISWLVSRYLCERMADLRLPYTSRIKNMLLHRVGYGHVQKQDWFRFWLGTGLMFPDLNMCFRRKALEKCMPPYRPGARNILDFWYNLNEQGFLPVCLPRVANFGRSEAGSITKVYRQQHADELAEYFGKLAALREDLRTGRKKHVFVDGEGLPIKVISQ